MWTYNYTNELCHYGVLGMKWGVRKGRSTSSKSTRKRKTSNYHDDYKKAHSGKYNKSAVKNMTNKIGNSKRVKELKANYEFGKQYGSFGVGMNVWGQTVRRYNNRMLKGAGAMLLNESANSFIKNSNASYGVKRGVDFVRKAGITALDISTAKDTIQMYANIGASALGMRDKYYKK